MSRWIVVVLAGVMTAGSALAQDPARRLVAAGAGAATAATAAHEGEKTAASKAPSQAPAKGLLPPIPERMLELSSLRGDGGREPGPDTPRGAVIAYLRAARDGDYQAAARFLDLADVPDAERGTTGPLLARRLKIVLDRALWVDPETLSDAPGGQADDGLPPEVDHVGTIESARGKFDINVWRRTAADGSATWSFTPGTLRRLDVLYAEYGYASYVEKLPEWMVRGRFLDLEIWQWIGLAALLAIAYLFSFLGSWIVYRIVRVFTRRTRTTLDDRILDAIHRPVRWMVALLLFLAGLGVLSLAVPAQTLVLRLVGALWVALVVWALVRLVDALTATIADRLQREGRRSGLSTVALARRVLKVVVVALGVLAVLQNQGFNVSGVVAGLGIGGIAVALAAQKTLENVFGGVVLATDQPIRVGDYCKFADKTGTVEDVGLRSTRVRTLDRTIVTVPNAELSTIQIENFAMRDKIRLLTTLGLRYETSPDQMRWLLAEIRSLLLAHPMIDRDGLRVRFVGFGASSLDVEVHAYVLTPEFNEFTAVREDLFLRIMDLVAAAGTGFAFPSRTLYLKRDERVGAEAAGRAEEQVKLWRASGDLPFPEPDPAKAAELRGTLDWPPRGSVARREPPPSGVSEE